MRTKLSQATAISPSNNAGSTVRDGRIASSYSSSLPPPLPLAATHQSHGYSQHSQNLPGHSHSQLRADARVAPALDTMPPGPPIVGPSTSTASAMAVQDLIDHDPDNSGPDGRKAKRELSQSKRAAQNRAAQVSIQTGVNRIPPLRVHLCLCIFVLEALGRRFTLFLRSTKERPGLDGNYWCIVSWISAVSNFVHFLVYVTRCLVQLQLSLNFFNCTTQPCSPVQPG